MDSAKYVTPLHIGVTCYMYECCSNAGVYFPNTTSGYDAEHVHSTSLVDHGEACSEQCWGKLLLKVMHYNIALLSKKVTNYVT